MLQQFIDLIRPWIDVAIYVLGSQGHLITSESQIRAMEDTTSHADRAIALWKKRGSRCYAFDCSGLIVWALMKLGLIAADMRADGIYDKCPKIAKKDLKLGDFCFRVNEVGNAHHVGVVLKIENGIPWVTEAKGRDDGVIERPIDADPGYWEKYASNIWLSGGASGGGEPDMYCKFGETSQAVNDLQKKLMKAFGQLVGDNGTVYKPGQETSYYGTATKNGVLDLLTEYGLPGDGKTFDELASAALTFKLAGIVQESAALKQKIVELERNLQNVNNLLLVEQNLSAQWAASDSAKKAELVKVAGAFDVLKSISDKY